MKGKPINFKLVKWIANAFLLIGSLLIGGCTAKITNPVSHTPVPNFLNPASPVVAQQARLFWIVMIPVVIIFVIVEGLLIYNVLHHAKRPEIDELPPQHYRQYLIEGIYTGVPILIVIVLFILMLGTMRATAAPLAQPTDLKLHVIGHRWWWEFDYPDLNIKTANELHIPVNTTVQIDLDSFDVIHSFYVPQLSSKTDVIPGVTNKMWIRADKIGEYHGQCSEYCGENHANMRFTVFVDSQADYNAWVANQQKPPFAPQTALQKTGQDIIVNDVCSTCHDLGDQGPGNAPGPDLTHLMSRQRFAGDVFDLNADNLQRWLEDTQAMKPGNDMKHKFTAQQIKALMAYLTQLK